MFTKRSNPESVGIIACKKYNILSCTGASPTRTTTIRTTRTLAPKLTSMRPVYPLSVTVVKTNDRCACAGPRILSYVSFSLLRLRGLLEETFRWRSCRRFACDAKAFCWRRTGCFAGVAVPEVSVRRVGVCRSWSAASILVEAFRWRRCLHRPPPHVKTRCRIGESSTRNVECKRTSISMEVRRRRTAKRVLRTAGGRLYTTVFAWLLHHGTGLQLAVRKTPAYCTHHPEDGMVDVRSKCFSHASGNGYPRFNFERSQACVLQTTC